MAQDQAGLAGAVRPTNPVIAATMLHRRAPGRVDYAGIPGAAKRVGRKRHLAVLREAFESTLEGRLVMVSVHGPSGVGKTAEVAWFLDEIRERNQPVVLEGRCYEREAVPYNRVVDNLDRYVRNLPRAQA
ncbi:MAG TPA: ATP-binding protein [Candidatus Binataceae bacterium]|nr:ATP-binding protein [Candidatus Binataceae bacterium]